MRDGVEGTTVNEGVYLSRRVALRILASAAVPAFGGRPPVLWARPLQHEHGGSGASEDTAARRRQLELSRGLSIYFVVFAILSLAVIGWAVLMTIRDRRRRLRKKPQSSPPPKDWPPQAAPPPRPRRRQ